MTSNKLSALFQPTENIPSAFKVCATGVWMNTGEDSWRKIARTPFTVAEIQQADGDKVAKVYLERTEFNGEATLVGLAFQSVLDNHSPLASQLAHLGIEIEPGSEGEIRTYLQKGVALASRFDQAPYQYCQPRDMARIAAMEVPAWEAIKEWYCHCRFPFDEVFVSQTGTKASVLQICAGYGVPDLAPFIEGYIYCAWRYLFLESGALLYCCGEDDFRPGALHVACGHDDSCDQVLSYSYFHSGPQIGDAIDFRRIQKPVVAERYQEKLDGLWATLKGDSVNPNGQVDYEAMAGNFFALLEAAIYWGKEPQLRQGIDGFSVKSFIFSGKNCTKVDSLDDFEPEEGLMLVIHAVIWGATCCTQEGAHHD